MKIVIYNQTGLPLSSLPIPDDVERRLSQGEVSIWPVAIWEADIGYPKKIDIQLYRQKTQGSLYFDWQDGGES